MVVHGGPALVDLFVGIGRAPIGSPSDSGGGFSCFSDLTRSMIQINAERIDLQADNCRAWSTAVTEHRRPKPNGDDFAKVCGHQFCVQVRVTQVRAGMAGAIGPVRVSLAHRLTKKPKKHSVFSRAD